jgi:dihydrofolate reductase
MRKVVVSQFVTLDGVMEDPGGAEGMEGGGWALRIGRGPDGDRFKLDEVMEAGALLLGRVTYEGFAAAWPDRTDEAGFADKFNSMPKHVVTSTRDELEWNNSTPIAGDIAGAIRRLKEQDGGDILVNGSAQLLPLLAENDLVDEYRLMVFPLVLGRGRRLFGEGTPPADLHLAEARPVGDEGVVILVYRPAREGS